MLNFITIKKEPRFEYRLYIENDSDIDGKIIYKGHKLGINDELLSNLLEYRIEKTSNKVYLKDYDSQDNWFVSNHQNTILVLQKSYESLQSKAERVFGKFRKIVITRV